MIVNSLSDTIALEAFKQSVSDDSHNISNVSNSMVCSSNAYRYQIMILLAQYQSS